MGRTKTETRLTRPIEKPWLSATALLSFIPSFVAARLFTFFRPNTVVVIFGIHFHHYWYGFGILAMAGWLGIAGPESWNRIAALMYGLGAALVADEIPLLLTPVSGTLGDYQSGLVYTLVVGIIAVTAMLSLLSRYWRQVIDDFRKVGVKEPLAFLALFVLIVPFVVQFVPFQASLVGLIIAVVYRWRLGGPWRIGRGPGFLSEAVGAIMVILSVFSVAYLVDLVVGIPVESSPTFILEFSRVLLILLAATVATGIFAGWAWVKFIVGPRNGRVATVSPVVNSP